MLAGANHGNQPPHFRLHPAFLLRDAVHSHFRLVRRALVTDPEAMLDIDLVRAHPHIVMTRTFSKAYGLAGMRVGYGIAQPTLAAKIARTGVPYALTTIAESAAIQAPTQPNHMRRAVERTNTERTRLASRLRQLGLHVVTGHGNFVWLPIPQHNQPLTRALARAGVIVKNYPGHGIRISIGTPEETDRLLSVWPKPTTTRQATNTTPTLSPHT